MTDIILWVLLAFFSAFGVVEFIKFVYTDFKTEQNDFHVVVKGTGIEEEVEETNYETEESVVVTSEEETTSVENSIEEMIAEQSGMDECVTEGIAEDKDSNGISSE